MRRGCPSLLLSLTVAAACTSRLTVPYWRPAEVNLGGLRQIAIGHIEGKGSDEMASDLASVLSEDGYLQVISSEETRDALTPFGYVGATLDTSLTSVMRGEFGPTALLVGRVTLYDWDQEVEEHEEKGYDELGRTRTFYFYKRHVWATVEASFKIIDCQRNTVVAVRMLKSRVDASTDDTKYLPQGLLFAPPTPPYIDERTLFAKARQQIAQSLKKTLTPHQDSADVYLYPDHAVPGLDEGIHYARAGDWRKAVESFEAAYQAHPESDKAMYDLGVAYEYTWQFDKALPLLEKVSIQRPLDRYQREVGNCKRLWAERQRLEEESSGAFN